MTWGSRHVRGATADIASLSWLLRPAEVLWELGERRLGSGRSFQVQGSARNSGNSVVSVV